MNTQPKNFLAAATIDQLKPGSERPGGSVNSRKDYDKADVKARLESILTFGLMRPLMVVTGPSADKAPFYVADGGLSREAIALGVKDKKLPADFPVNVSIVSFDNAMALAASIEANKQVVPPHPVKAYEAFVELRARGKTEDEIAKLFRMEKNEARRILALGALSPKIRKAWINEDIRADAAKAFTLAPDHATQDAIFDKLKKSRDLYEGAVRNAIIGDSRNTGPKLVYVGKAAYEAAGGKLQDDLFAEDSAQVVLDAGLLNKLAVEKFETDLAALKSAGWGEAVSHDDLPQGAWWNWEAVKGGAKANAAIKAKSVAAVQLSREGALDIRYLVRPEASKTAKAAAAKKKTASPTALSNTLAQALESQKTQATQDALLAVSKGKDIGTLLCGVVAAQINFRNLNYTPEPIRKALDEIRARLPAKILVEAIARRFVAKDYFEKASTTVVLVAVSQALGKATADAWKGKKKGDLAKFALANVTKTGWLPVELRTVHYTGPGSVKAKTKGKTR